ncbi:hypothetical protein NBRC110019_07540 [Neptunitalea chrysea]|uniref:Terminase n=1 Tax=Neptunitalea chrysea TaxID=1647581 RepID=A0A9W6B3J1_9FLAO|nr:hypothetical protein [Neptunitalea chrysea]GLB51715.1 hypothetical protein NBRC110019_07540 [Neptunitalea chrysea]
MKREDKIALERYKKRLEFARSAGQINPYETKDEQKARIERAKRDPEYLVQEYFPHYATAACADFQIESAMLTLKNPTIKLFDQWGRGLAKSVWDDIIKPFWLWIQNEAHYMVVVTVNKDRAAELAEDLRAEFEANPKIIHDFGEQSKSGQWEKGFYITKDGFIVKGLGAGQSVRGLRVKSRRPDYIVVDDLETKETVKNPARQDEYVKWIERDLIPTMDGKIRRFLYANNRFAPVMIQTKLQEKHPKWKVLQVNAYDPVTYKPTWWQKYDDDYYRELEDPDEGIGILAAQAEYNNKPHVEGTIFKQENVQWGKMPKINHFNIIFGFWDIAYAGTKTSDYNAIVLQGVINGDYWIIDNFCKQSKMAEAVAYMCNITKDWLKRAPTVTIHWRYEAQFWNDEVERIIQEGQKLYNVKLNISRFDGPKTKKYDRILRLHPYYQSGRIYYSDKLKSNNDTQTGIAQLMGIEPGYKTHDDWPDAHQQGIALLEPYNGKGKGNGKMKQGRMKPKHARI